MIPWFKDIFENVECQFRKILQTCWGHLDFILSCSHGRKWLELYNLCSFWNFSTPKTWAVYTSDLLEQRARLHVNQWRLRFWLFSLSWLMCTEQKRLLFVACCVSSDNFLPSGACLLYQAKGKRVQDCARIKRRHSQRIGDYWVKLQTCWI